MVKRAPARRRPRKAKPGTKGLGPAECWLDQPTGAAAEAAETIAKAGGCVVGSYKEPLGGHPVLLSILPIDAVEPTPFQRDLSMLITNLTELFSRIVLRVRAERFQDSLVSSWSISFLSIAMGPPILSPETPAFKLRELR